MTKPTRKQTEKRDKEKVQETYADILLICLSFESGKSEAPKGKVCVHSFLDQWQASLQSLSMF